MVSLGAARSLPSPATTNAKSPAASQAPRMATAARAGRLPRSILQLNRSPAIRAKTASAAANRTMKKITNGKAISSPRRIGAARGVEDRSFARGMLPHTAVTNRVPAIAAERATRAPRVNRPSNGRSTTFSPPKLARAAPVSATAPSMSRVIRFESPRTAANADSVKAAMASQASLARGRGRVRGRRSQAAASKAATAIGALTPSAVSTKSHWSSSPIATAARPIALTLRTGADPGTISPAIVPPLSTFDIDRLATRVRQGQPGLPPQLLSAGCRSPGARVTRGSGPAGTRRRSGPRTRSRPLRSPRR